MELAALILPLLDGELAGLSNNAAAGELELRRGVNRPRRTMDGAIGPEPEGSDVLTGRPARFRGSLTVASGRARHLSSARAGDPGVASSKGRPHRSASSEPRASLEAGDDRA